MITFTNFEIVEVTFSFFPIACLLLLWWWFTRMERLRRIIGAQHLLDMLETVEMRENVQFVKNSVMESCMKDPNVLYRFMIMSGKEVALALSRCSHDIASDNLVPGKSGGIDTTNVSLVRNAFASTLRIIGEADDLIKNAPSLPWFSKEEPVFRRLQYWRKILEAPAEIHILKRREETSYESALKYIEEEDRYGRALLWLALREFEGVGPEATGTYNLSNHDNTILPKEWVRLLHDGLRTTILMQKQ